MRTATTLKGIYALWYREYKVFTREKSRIVSSVFMPLFWYFIFGYGVGSIVSIGGGANGFDYRHFIFPGFLVMTVIFTGMFNGAYVVWDKKIDFLKEVLITPLSRTVIFTGKALGGMTDALLQACILLLLGVFIGVGVTVWSAAAAIATLCVFAAGLVSLGLIIGSFMESPEGFGMVASFAVYPLFLLSGALFPLDRLPAWLRILTLFDPGTYAVDALRRIILHTSALPFATDMLALLGFDAALILFGAWAFKRMKL